MEWKIRFHKDVEKDLKKVDKIQRERIFFYCRKIVMGGSPRKSGRALKGEFSGIWRYRMGDYRLLCHIQDDVLTILVLSIGHRKNIYKKISKLLRLTAQD